jgi:hypothetical protein
VTGDWRKLYNEELNYLNSSPFIVRMIKSRRIRWARHVARMGERRGVYRVLVGKSEERDHLGERGVDGRIIFKWIFRKWNVGCGLDRAGSGLGKWRARMNAVMNLRVSQNTFLD